MRGQQIKDGTIEQIKLNLVDPTTNSQAVTKGYGVSKYLAYQTLTNFRQLNKSELSDKITVNDFLYKYDASDTTSADNGTTIIKTLDGKVYKKIYSDLSPNDVTTINSKLPFGSISQLRAFSDITITSFQVTNKGKSGLFIYDSTDTTSMDDGINTILQGSRVFKREFRDVYPEDSGAIGDGTTDDTVAIQKALTFSGGIVISKVFKVGSMTFPANKTISFRNGGRILIKAGANVIWLSKINASADDWIFDCEDIPTNYTKQNVVTTTKPLIFKGSTELTSNATNEVHLKWFGAIGAGYSTDMILNNYGTLTVTNTNNRYYVDDTKAIRFALTSIGESGHLTESGDFAYGGPNVLRIPKGVFCVNDNIYISGGTNIIGAGRSQGTGSRFMMINPLKSFIFQAPGSGGEGGSGSAHNISDLSIGCRPTQGGLGTTNAFLITFHDQKFNRDTRFERVRFTVCPARGQLFYINEKNSHYVNPNGEGTAIGLEVTMHLYDCMFDVIPGEVLKVGTSGKVRALFSRCQFYNIFDGIVTSIPKTIGNIEGDKSSSFTFDNCTGEGVGVIDSYAANIDDQYAELILNNFVTKSATIDDNKMGAPIKVTRALSVEIIDGKYTSFSTEENGTLYFLNLNGVVDNLTIKGVTTAKYNDEPTISTINISSAFGSKNLNISNNNFYVNPLTNNIIYSANPSYVSFGKIENNVFHKVAQEAILGNLNPNLVLQDNIFETPQSPKATSLQNLGMKGHSVVYGTTFPSTGTWFTGDRCYSTNLSAGVSFWVYDESESAWIPSNKIKGLISNGNLSLAGNILPTIASNFNVGADANRLGSIFAFNSTFNNIKFESSGTYADNAAAVAAGIPVSRFYLTPDGTVKCVY